MTTYFMIVFCATMGQSCTKVEGPFLNTGPCIVGRDQWNRSLPKDYLGVAQYHCVRMDVPGWEIVQ